jgi:hypothetical protein
MELVSIEATLRTTCSQLHTLTATLPVACSLCSLKSLTIELIQHGVCALVRDKRQCSNAKHILIGLHLGIDIRGIALYRLEFLSLYVFGCANKCVSTATATIATVLIANISSPSSYTRRRYIRRRWHRSRRASHIKLNSVCDRCRGARCRRGLWFPVETMLSELVLHQLSFLVLPFTKHCLSIRRVKVVCRLMMCNS